MRRWTLPLAAMALAFWSVTALAHDVASRSEAFRCKVAIWLFC